MDISREKFKEILSGICQKDTSSDPDGWTPENPLWGHCAVVSLLAQDFFGGELIRISLAEVKGYEHMHSHYFNRLPDGSHQDFTETQFMGLYPSMKAPEIRTRSNVLSHSETLRRYKLLYLRAVSALDKYNLLFEDEIYQKCLSAALDSPCRKMRFGAVLIYKNKIAATDCNRTIRHLESLCEPECIRLSIQSRTESMLGACGHAEEWALWSAVHKKLPLGQCQLFVAGIKADGLPWIKERAEFTCLRCAVMIQFAWLKKVYVPVGSKWAGLTPEKAVQTAKAYALREKKV